MFGRMVSDMMVKPGLSPVFDDPRAFGLEHEDVEFEASDGVTIRGWLIDGGTDRVIVQSHFGVQCSRAGYTPEGKGMIKLWKENISFLRQAKHLVEQGYSVLMYDMRNHGESDAGSCPWVTWGPEEAKDIIAAVDFLTKHPRYENANIGLLSICMGSSATTYAYGMGDQGLARYDNIKAMMAVQPLHYSDFVKAFGLPSFLNKAGSKVTLERTGVDLNARTFIDDVKHIPVPTMVVQNENDPWTNLDFVRRFHHELTSEKELVLLDLSKDRAAAYDHLGESPRMISDYFGRFL